jgi:hypothetical protein
VGERWGESLGNFSVVSSRTRKAASSTTGDFATLRDVMDHYDGAFGLGLSEQEKSNLVEYVKSP